MGGRTCVGPAIALWLGLLAGEGWGVFGSIASLLGGGALLWTAGRAPARTGTFAVVLAFGLMGLARGEAHRLRMDAQARYVPEDRHATWVQGACIEPPARGGAAPVAIVRVTAAEPLLVPGTLVRLALPAGATLEWGDRFQAFAWLARPAGRRNPGGFDAAAAAAGRGRVAEGRALAVVAIDSTGWHAWPRTTVARWRRAIEQTLARQLSPAAREVVAPLVTGDRSILSPDLRGTLQHSGLVHLLALSGLHVTWLAGVARFIVGVAGGGPLARAVAGAGCALLYVGLAGPLPSLLRATLMECMSTAAQVAERELDPVQSLGATVLLLLGCVPAWAGDLAFQLSCAATLGLVTLLPWVHAHAGRGKAVVLLPAVTVCAQLPALPLLLSNFHGVSWSVTASNLMAAPIVGLLLAAAWSALVIEGLLPGLGAVLFAACEALAFALSQVATLGASLPHAMLPAGSGAGPVWVVAIGAYVLCWAASVRVPHLLAPTLEPSRLRAGVAGGALWIAGVLSALGPSPRQPPRHHVWVVMLDVGQGQAMAIGFHDGWWLVDAGVRTPRYDAGLGVVLPFFRVLGVRRLDALIVTHGDIDHAGGAAAVMRALRPARTWGAVGVPVMKDDVLRIDDAPLHVLWPHAGATMRSRNESSVVLWLDSPRRAVFTADVDSTVEALLEIDGVVDVLQVGHHGAASSAGASFVARARPRRALVSAGRRNRFGHPDSLTLMRLRQVGAEILRTDLEGAVWLELRRGGVQRIEWRHGLPDPVSHTRPVRPVLARPNPHC